VCLFCSFRARDGIEIYSYGERVSKIIQVSGRFLAMRGRWYSFMGDGNIRLNRTFGTSALDPYRLSAVRKSGNFMKNFQKTLIEKLKQTIIKLEAIT
jgi:hypothetical protein